MRDDDECCPTTPIISFHYEKIHVCRSVPNFIRIYSLGRPKAGGLKRCAAVELMARFMKNEKNGGGTF